MSVIFCASIKAQCSRVHAFTGTCIHGYARSRVRAFTGTCVHGYQKVFTVFQLGTRERFSNTVLHFAPVNTTDVRNYPLGGVSCTICETVRTPGLLTTVLVRNRGPDPGTAPENRGAFGAPVFRCGTQVWTPVPYIQAG